MLDETGGKGAVWVAVKSPVQWLLVVLAALVLFVAPWRFVNRFPVGGRFATTQTWAPIIAPPISADAKYMPEIDVNRYGVQVFAFAAFLGFLTLVRKSRPTP